MDYVFLLILCASFVSCCQTEKVMCHYCVAASNANDCYLYTQTCNGECLDQINTYHDTLQQTYTKGCVITCTPGERNFSQLGYTRNVTCCSTSKCNNRGMNPRASGQGWMVIGITTGIIVVLIVMVLVIAWMCQDGKVCKKKSRRTQSSRTDSCGNSLSESHTNQVFDLSEVPIPTAPIYTIQDSNPPPTYEDTVGNNVDHHLDTTQQEHPPTYEI